MEKTCSKCSASFTCKNEERGCWCEDLALGAEALALLQRQFDNCLCPACLATYTSVHKGSEGELLNPTP